MQKNGSIIVVGSSNFDIIISVKKNPKDGESILAKDLFTDYGGKGATQAVTASKLGGNVKFLTCLGDDVFGKLVYENFKEKEMDLEFIKVFKDQKNGMAAGTFDEKGENIVIVYPGANSLLDKDIISENIILKSAEREAERWGIRFNPDIKRNINIKRNRYEYNNRNIEKKEKVNILGYIYDEKMKMNKNYENMIMKLKRCRIFLENDVMIYKFNINNNKMIRNNYVFYQSQLVQLEKEERDLKKSK